MSHFGILGGDEDFLDLLERPLLHEDMQRLMEIEQELRIDASCREAFPEVVGSPLEVFSLEDTIEDLNEVIQKEMGCPQAGGPHIGSMQNSFEEKTYIKLGKYQRPQVNWCTFSGWNMYIMFRTMTYDRLN